MRTNLRTPGAPNRNDDGDTAARTDRCADGNARRTSDHGHAGHHSYPAPARLALTTAALDAGGNLCARIKRLLRGLPPAFDALLPPAVADMIVARAQSASTTEEA
jgi:hypothetical protein